MNRIAIVGAKRTAQGGFQGQFSATHATQLGSAAIAGALNQAGLDAAQIEEVLMDCVLPAGLGQAPARQAALGAGIPVSVPCTTLNKVCGSAMKAVMLGCDMINAGSANTVIAGGMESMTNAPYLLPGARAGYRMGHHEVVDHMFFDGLQNPYDKKLMGEFAEQCAEKYAFTRDIQDNFAIASVNRAMAAMEKGTFKLEIAPVTVHGRRGATVIDSDEEPPRCDLAKVPKLRPAFSKDGTVTAANASKISDGAAAMALCSEAQASESQLEVLGHIVGQAGFAQEPEWFTTAPTGAIRKLLEKMDWRPDDVDLYEINEAFAVVTLSAMHELGLDHDKVNVNGGACALGHPLGASGCRIAVSLLYALRERGLKRGIAALCIGGGEATAIALEAA